MELIPFWLTNLTTLRQSRPSKSQLRIDKELSCHNQTSSEAVSREGRTEMHFYHHIEHQQSRVHRPEHHQGRHGGYRQNSQHYGTTNPTMKYRFIKKVGSSSMKCSIRCQRTTGGSGVRHVFTNVHIAYNVWCYHSIAIDECGIMIFYSNHASLIKYIRAKTHRSKLRLAPKGAGGTSFPVHAWCEQCFCFSLTFN